MCKCLWRNGQARQLGLAEGGPLKPITIYEADFKEIIEEKEAAECPSEDLLNEVSATENEQSTKKKNDENDSRV